MPIALDFARPFNNRIEVVDAKSMKITSLTLHFFKSVPLALIFFLKKKKNPQPVASREPVAGAPSFSGIAVSHAFARKLVLVVRLPLDAGAMRLLLALNVSAGTAHVRQLSKAFRKTYARYELFAGLPEAAIHDDSGERPDRGGERPFAQAA